MDRAKKQAAGADGTLVIALPSQPENLNPILGNNVYEGNLKFFNGLLHYKTDLSPEPDLASWHRCSSSSATCWPTSCTG